MIGLLVELAASWLLLWFVEKKRLSVLGFAPTAPRLLHLFGGLVGAAIFCVTYTLTMSSLTNNTWSSNPDFTLGQWASSSWWTLKSVLFEELIFRGAIFYILIQKTNAKVASGISAVAFGLYHWFSFGVIGNPVMMVYVFVSTGLWGLMYAWSCAKTNSLYLPVGLHPAWNLFNIVVFSNGPLGKRFLINSSNGIKPALLGDDYLSGVCAAAGRICFNTTR
ncbi:MAG TPA: type II CAAX endopeptidase family protein [Cyclobacteriaceae bacterium]|jgi:membrane protease YdiL (CAAX protease family)|nr:type II CAAX endopeptidase family protein [Cyclobacteriaceae bacterium]